MSVSGRLSQHSRQWVTGGETAVGLKCTEAENISEAAKKQRDSANSAPALQALHSFKKARPLDLQDENKMNDKGRLETARAYTIIQG
jgi:hypothetical protein